MLSLASDRLAKTGRELGLKAQELEVELKLGYVIVVACAWSYLYRSTAIRVSLPQTSLASLSHANHS